MSNVIDATVDDFQGEATVPTDQFSTIDQYDVYPVPKKSGGSRWIEAPNDALKAAQKASLRRLQRIFMNDESAAEAFKQHQADVGEILAENGDGKLRNADEVLAESRQRLSSSLRGNKPVLQYSHFAHAFCNDRNIASGAHPHVGQFAVITADLSDFFPSIKFEHFDPDWIEHTPGNSLKGWKSYKRPLSYVFGNDKTKQNAAFMEIYRRRILPEIKVHFCDFGDGKGLRLPQGAPASPFLSNVLLCRLDYRVAWKAFAHDVTYTRYADDLIFSGPDPVKAKQAYADAVRLIIPMGLQVNRRKYTYKEGNQRKKILGLVVNERLNVPRYRRRRNRAAQHHGKVLHTLQELARERGFTLPPDIASYLLSRTEGVAFKEKMHKMVAYLQEKNVDISMDDLQSKRLLTPPRWQTRKMQGHSAFEEMVYNYEPRHISSIQFCNLQEMLHNG